ncbi:MAG: hypothetical protein J6Q17_01860 [Clostridia bacterium]|nr:hypothetical protein [Clostridia bacterium]
MKKLLILLLCLPMLAACGKGAYPSVPFAPSEQGSKPSAIPAIPTFQVSSVPLENRSSALPGAVLCSRGWIFIDGGGVARVYSPEAGTVNALCSDPLCSHLPDSDCAYRSCVFTEIPVQAGERLWLIARADWEENSLLPARSVCSTDLYGRDKKIHYENDGAEMYGLYAEEDFVWWLERVGDEQFLLTRYDVRKKKIARMPCGEDEHKILSGIVRLGDRVFYTLDDGMIRSCRTDFSDDVFVAQTRGTELYASERTGCAYWLEEGAFISYDPTSKRTETVIVPPEGFRFFTLLPTDYGFAYTLIPEDTEPFKSYTEYLGAVTVDPALFLWDPVTGERERLSLPEGIIPTHLSAYAGGILFTSGVHENEWTHTPAFPGWIACQPETGEFWEVEP